MTFENLAAAARFLDKRATPEDSLDVLGVPPEDLSYVADQRALRVILALIRRESLPGKMERIELSSYERTMLKLFKAAYIDGISIGIAAANGLSEPLTSTHSEN